MSDRLESPSRRSRLARLAIVTVGLVICQVLLFAPSLAGRKLLLPLDILATSGTYLPDTPSTRATLPHNLALADQVFWMEWERLYAAEELRAGRLPLWTPYQFAGTPSARWPKYSPYTLLSVIFSSPILLAWLQMLKSLVAGLGAYLFIRRVLSTGFWPAAIAAWCYPLTGFFMLWQGFLMSYTVAWLPWILLATWRVVRQPRGWGGASLAILTALVLTTGQLDVAALVLIASGLFGLCCLGSRYGSRILTGPALRAVGALTLAWALGLLLAAPYTLPLIDYAREGARIERRSAGEIDRPPIGREALAQAVLPEAYGSDRRGSVYILEGNQMESAAQAYTGLLATLLLAPLAWNRRSQRSKVLCWSSLGLLAFAWVLGLPGVTAVLSVSPLALLSYNRFVFLTSFVILVLSAVGLDVLWRGEAERRWWTALPIALLALLGGWCAYRLTALPEPVATRLGALVEKGQSFPTVPDLATVRAVQASFESTYMWGFLLTALGIAGWALLWARPKLARRLAPLLGLLLVAELLWSARDVNPQCDRELYFPPISALSELREQPPGRVLAVGCLPARLAESHRLTDLRGYDGVDPARFMDLMEIAADERSPRIPEALTQIYVPRLGVSDSGEPVVSPVLDMLNARYLVFRGDPTRGARSLLSGDDHWVMENPRALPRVYVPRRVEIVEEDAERLRRLSDPRFDARDLAFVESEVKVHEEVRGTGEIVAETPGRIEIAVEMETPGLVVLADRWDKGWRARLGERSVPILRTNHALRGVLLPPGNHRLVFSYEPVSFVWGTRMMLVALVGLLGWAAWEHRRLRSPG